MPLQATSGAASYDAFGGGVPVVPAYIEEVFSTYLYTGNGSTQTITNGIDLSTKGGLVWIKRRDSATNHQLADTVRGATKYIYSNLTDQQDTVSTRITSFNSDGFSLGSNVFVNNNTFPFVSWTFRKQPKFFDVVTYTGNGGTPQNIAHSLGSVPGFIVVKPTSITGSWICYHRSLTASGFNPAPYNTINLNSTGSIMEDTGAWNSTAPTSTVFTIGSSPDVNTNGATYVAYLFAHDAGGFGLTGTDNVISCGSYVEGGAGTEQTINLGYEAQWLLVRTSALPNSWYLYDTMRGFSQTDNLFLRPNTSNADTAGSDPYLFKPTATGFIAPGDFFGSSANVIYIAIRRGPMKVPTSGTSVFNTKLRTGTDVATTISGIGFPTDLVFSKTRTPGGNNPSGVDFDRLRGIKQLLTIESTEAEYTKDPPMSAFTQDGYSFIAGANDPNVSGYTYCDWNFRRAPSFFDEVCYIGTEVSGQTFNHNLGAVPEMMIVKSRSGTTDWTVYHSALGASARIYLNLTNAANTGTAAPWNSTAPTSTVFSLGNAGATNLSGTTFVNYLFATCAGVSKVGSYTGTATTLQVDCGFTSGARFVLIKRTDSTGAWYVWDSARGIVSGNDPYLLLNSTAVEVTNTDYIDTYSAGFEISSTAPSAINASGGSFIFLAIA